MSLGLPPRRDEVDAERVLKGAQGQAEAAQADGSEGIPEQNGPHQSTRGACLGPSSVLQCCCPEFAEVPKQVVLSSVRHARSAFLHHTQTTALVVRDSIHG